MESQSSHLQSISFPDINQEHSEYFIFCGEKIVHVFASLAVEYLLCGITAKVVTL